LRTPRITTSPRAVAAELFCTGLIIIPAKVTNIYDNGSSIAFSLKQAVQIQLLCGDLLDFKTPLKPLHHFEGCQVNHLGEFRVQYTYYRKLTHHPQGFGTSLSWKITTGWAPVVGT
jgi:hypothetical protein